MSEMDDFYPSGPEDNHQLIEEMPTYRGIGGQVFDPLPSVFSESFALPDEDELMVDIPTYHKGAANGLPVKGAMDASFANLLINRQAISLVIPDSSPSSGSRTASPFTNKLPIYDSDELLPLESTHFRVTFSSGGSTSPCPELAEETLFCAINDYLSDHTEQISVSTEQDLLAGASVGFWKCSTGTVHEDFSCANNYSGFGIQCYVDGADGQLIVEWQRRKGNVRMFHTMFEHFSSSLATYMGRACKRTSNPDVVSIEAMTVVPSSHPGRMSTAVSTVSKLFIDPEAGADLHSEYTPATMRKTVSAGGSVTVTGTGAISSAVGMLKLQRDKTTSNISPTGPADMIAMFNE